MFFSNTNRTNLTNCLGYDQYVFVGFGRFVVYNSYANMFFFEHESHESNELFRLRPGIYSWDSGDSWSIIHTLICFFSNTNRTNLTNCLGCDPVYIRGIREIRGL